jgi:hypothetical protein
MMNRDKMFVSTRNMKNIIKMLGTVEGGQNRFTDVSNLHTCPICSLNVVVPVVAFMHGELFNLTGDVVGCPRVQIPVGVSISGCRGHSSNMLLGDVNYIKSVPADTCCVPYLEAHLALRSVLTATSRRMR